MASTDASSKDKSKSADSTVTCLVGTALWVSSGRSRATVPLDGSGYPLITHKFLDAVVNILQRPVQPQSFNGHSHLCVGPLHSEVVAVEGARLRRSLLSMPPGHSKLNSVLINLSNPSAT